MKNFVADAEIFRLTAEACRIKFAVFFEPYSAIHSSRIEPLPHQISAVYEKMLPQNPLRFLLADDPGAGKTVMTGLFVKELIARAVLKRCLIICPGTLAEQWQDELHEKFFLNFKILADENFSDFCIAPLDKLARNKNLQENLRGSAWDLIVCDEAHKMSATLSGNKIKYTRRFHLGKLLGKIARNFLLLTATPHNGKREDFHLFMSLIDPDRFEGAKRLKNNVDVSDLMRRLVKEDLLTFDAKPLFPERIAYTVNYKLSAAEKNLYEQVTSYVANEFNRAERLTGDKKNSVGFAMTILQRRLASSPRAIYKSLERRAQRLQKIKLDNKIFLDAEDLDEYEDFQNPEAEDELAERVTSARTIAELEQEIKILKQLAALAKKVLFSGEDKKWFELSELLQTDDHFLRREKLIIFTEHRDTLEYLREKISSLFGQEDLIATIHGGLNHRERRRVEEKFKSDENVLILIATDAAGEGINLQNAHLMINYDLPWNPNRLEQRFGRIHRIGQKKICYLWNLVAAETREGQVFNRLLKKLETERLALGGKVFDILGKISFDNKPLRELLIEAIRNGSDSQRLDKIMDKTFDADKLKEIFRERALTNDFLGAEKVSDINLNIERNEIRKLQPYCVENFFIAAFWKLGGHIFSCGGGRYEISHSPKNFPPYKQICFSKTCADAEFISIGHPLLNAVVEETLENFGDALRQGTIFIDENSDEQNSRVLFMTEIKIQDERKEILSRQLNFLEISEDEKIFSANHAPYLDYRSPNEDERQKILSIEKDFSALDKNALDFVQKNFSAPLLKKIQADKKIFLDKLEREIKTRLQSEINFWDTQAAEKNSAQATKIADELEERLKRRLEEISLQRKISAQIEIIGRALIVPKKFFESPPADNRPRIEQIAMQAVMKIERELGNAPVDVSEKKCGYDIESADSSGHLRFIEVKGRIAAAETVTVSKNEILTALNSPENFILAIVLVEKNSAHAFYIKTPFTSPPDLNAVSVTYKISPLLKGKVILKRNIPLGGD